MKKYSVIIATLAVTFFTYGSALAEQKCGNFSQGEQVTVNAPVFDGKTFDVNAMYDAFGKDFWTSINKPTFIWKFGFDGAICPVSDKIPLGFSLKFADSKGDAAIGMLQIDLSKIQPGMSINPTLVKSPSGNYCLKVSGSEGVVVIYGSTGKKDCP